MFLKHRVCCKNRNVIYFRDFGKINTFAFAFASILVCPQFEDYHQSSARREMVEEV